MESQDHYALERDEGHADTNLPKLAYSIDEAAEVSGLSRTFIYAEWQAGRGPRKIKAGKRTLIMADALRSWLCSLESAAA
jgi:predicted DNA-binding transcriptional regulator AlpA